MERGGEVHITKEFALGAFIILLPATAYANAGVPMLFLAMPAFLISLIPIIAVETLYLSRSLGMSTTELLKTVSLSNLVSTVVGIPLTWFLLVLIQMMTGGGNAHGVESFADRVLAVTWQAPWLMPYDQNMGWMIPLAGLVLLIPFFFASWWSEYYVSRKMLKSVSADSIRLSVRNANLITYMLLATWPIGFWLLSFGH